MTWKLVRIISLPYRSPTNVLEWCRQMYLHTDIACIYFAFVSFAVVSMIRKTALYVNKVFYAIDYCNNT